MHIKTIYYNISSCASYRCLYINLYNIIRGHMATPIRDYIVMVCLGFWQKYNKLLLLLNYFYLIYYMVCEVTDTVSIIGCW